MRGSVKEPFFKHVDNSEILEHFLLQEMFFPCLTALRY